MSRISLRRVFYELFYVPFRCLHQSNTTTTTTTAAAAAVVAVVVLSTLRW